MVTPLPNPPVFDKQAWTDWAAAVSAAAANGGSGGGGGVPADSPAFTGIPTINGVPVAKTSDVAAVVGSASEQAALLTMSRPVSRAGILPAGGNRAGSIADYTAAAGQSPDSAMVAYDYTMQPETALLSSWQAGGYVPVIGWMPYSGAASDQTPYRLANITAGNFDTYMRTFLTTLKTLGFPIIIRWGHEMNGDWYPWSERANGNSAGQYAPAFQHVVALARSVAATNVKWMWAPTSNYSGSGPLAGLYPGDNSVDVVAVNGYNWGSTHASGWRTASAVFDATFAEIATFTTGRPLWLGEVGCDEVGGSKSAWILDFFNWLILHNIHGFTWYNAQVAENGGTFDWRVNSTPAAATAFGQGVAVLRVVAQRSGIHLPNADDSNRWSGTQDFTGATMLGLPTAPTLAALGGAPLNATATWRATNYTLSVGDNGKQINFDSASALTFTIPVSTAVPFAIGTTVDLFQNNVGQVTIAPASGVTINSRGQLKKLYGQYAVASIRQVATDVWVLYGDLA